MHSSPSLPAKQRMLLPPDIHPFRTLNLLDQAPIASLLQKEPPTGEKKQLQSYHNQFLHIILLLFLKYPPQLKLVPH